MAISTAEARAIVGRSAVCTTIAAGAAGLTALAWSRYMRRIYDLVAVCNGILAGLVAITASCACVEPWAAIIIGSTGALLFNICETIILAGLKVRTPPRRYAGASRTLPKAYISVASQPLLLTARQIGTLCR